MKPAQGQKELFMIKIIEDIFGENVEVLGKLYKEIKDKINSPKIASHIL